MRRCVLWHSTNEDAEGRTTAAGAAADTERRRQAAVEETMPEKSVARL